MKNFSILLLSSCAALAQAPQQGKQAKAPPQPMSFFVASAGSGKGADLGGLAGADQHCQMLAQGVGSSYTTWHAYLSTQAADGKPAVNARDRIGQGPWYNQKGQMVARNLSDLHGDTLEAARLGNNLTKATAFTEKGDPIKGFGDTPNQHDMLTGSQPDGKAFAAQSGAAPKAGTSAVPACRRRYPKQICFGTGRRTGHREPQVPDVERDDYSAQWNNGPA